MIRYERRQFWTQEAEMRRRLYFILPDVENARRMMNEMLLARIEARHIHFLAKPEISLGDLPLANVAQRSDMVHSAEVGMMLGAGLGLLAGVLAVLVPPWYVPVPLVTIPITTVVGAFASAWWLGMLATAIPNSRLKQFEVQLEQGKVLMMVAVPFHQVEQIRELLAKTHPEAAFGGAWPTDHVVFP